MIYCTRPDCTNPALGRGQAKNVLCRECRRQDIVAQNRAESAGLQTLEISEWNEVRGYDPVTRTYKPNHNEPPAGRPKGERWT